MRVRELVLRNVLSHADTRVAFPDTGLVVVTGPNGAGKSALAEGVALGVWGETLRGTPAWTTGAKTGFVGVCADGVTAVRERRGGKTTLKWGPDEATEEGRALDAVARLSAAESAWESTTQAQAALGHLVGAFDTWRRGCTFSSGDAAHFSLASDGERKRLLESILGLGRFDDALEACRLDLRVAEAECDGAAAAIREKRAGIEQAEKRLADAEAACAEEGPEVPDAPHGSLTRAAERKRLRDLVARAEVDERRADVLVRRLERAGGEHEGEARALRERVARLASGRCGACEQEVSPGHLDGLRAREADAEARLAAARAAADRDRAATSSEYEELQEETRALRHQVAELEREDAAAHASWRADLARASARARSARATEDARADLAYLQEALAASEADLASARRRALVLGGVEHALGLKGVRAHVLAGALAGVDAVANAWLPRLGRADLRVELRPYSERKKGGVVDAISVRVLGAGGDYGYRGASAGERRRVDVALLVGVSEVAGGAVGRDRSTLWFDELFDGLDAPGRAAAVDVLAELARDRVVVVVTHDDRLAAGLPARVRLRVADGVVLDGSAEDAVERLGGDPALLGTGGTR